MMDKQQYVAALLEVWNVSNTSAGTSKEVASYIQSALFNVPMFCDTHRWYTDTAVKMNIFF